MNKINTLTESKTDWARIDAMTDDEIDLSDIPETTDEMWAKGVWKRGSQINAANFQEKLEIDRDVIEFFKSQGQNYPQKINQLLRAYMEAQ